MALKLLPLSFLPLLITSHAWSQEQLDVTAEMQKHFADAYNRGDVVAMANTFTENAVRITPSGIFQGRDAIRRGFEDALRLGLHDYSVERVISRPEGNFVFNAGKWRAKLGDQPFQGYYSAIVVRDGDQTKIMEETVTVASP
jgi:ketosteroid isomerase-like protein